VPLALLCLSISKSSCITLGLLSKSSLYFNQFLQSISDVNFGLKRFLTELLAPANGLAKLFAN
jgi:hypothetical protein